MYCGICTKIIQWRFKKLWTIVRTWWTSRTEKRKCPTASSCTSPAASAPQRAQCTWRRALLPWRRSVWRWTCSCAPRTWHRRPAAASGSWQDLGVGRTASPSFWEQMRRKDGGNGVRFKRRWHGKRWGGKYTDPDDPPKRYLTVLGTASILGPVAVVAAILEKRRLLFPCVQDDQTALQDETFRSPLLGCQEIKREPWR